MSEFNTRIAAQRDILLSVNSREWHEELFGLSSGAIDRWVATSHPTPDLVVLIRNAADKLFFLSNKSQEQITEDYKMLSREVSVLAEQIKRSVACAP